MIKAPRSAPHLSVGQDATLTQKVTLSVTYKGKSVESLDLCQGQYLVGSTEKSDIHLGHIDKSHGPYLLLIEVSAHQMSVINLTSESDQLLVEGKPVSERYCSITTFSFKHRDYDFSLQPCEKLTDESRAGQHVSRSKAVIIENEKCDIFFDESQFQKSNVISIDRFAKDKTIDFVDHELEAPLNIIDKDHQEEVIEILLISLGNIISYDIIPKDKVHKWYRYVGQDFKDYFGADRDLLSADKLGMTIHPPEGFDRHGEALLFDGDPVFLFKGTVQLVIRQNIRPRSVKRVFPFRDKKEWKNIAILFLILFLPLTLLSLISLPELKPIKEPVVVIYKPIPPVKPETAENKSDSSESAAKATAVEPKKNKTDKKVAVKKQSHKVAKSKKSNQKVAKKAKPKVDLSSKLGGLFSKSSTQKDFQGKSRAEQGSSSSQMLASSSQSQLKAASGAMANVGKLDTSGAYDGKDGYKNQGQSGKHGFSGELSSTRTVVVGSIDPELLRKLMREYIPQFRYCYQEELGRNQDLEGVIDLNFVLDKNGKIAKSSVTSKKGNFSAKGTSCIDKVLRMIPFPAPKGGGQVEVRQPLNFSAEKTKL